MKLLIILLLPLLASCAVYESYFVTQFDSNEYKIITEIGLDANMYKKQCLSPMAKTNAMKLAYKSELFVRYTKELPNNNHVHNAAIQLNDIVTGLTERYNESKTVSKAFCELKYDNIENAALIIQHASGGKTK